MNIYPTRIGRVTKFDDRGYGFIREITEGRAADTFFVIKNVHRRLVLKPGDMVTYKVIPSDFKNDGRDEAIDISLRVACDNNRRCNAEVVSDLPDGNVLDVAVSTPEPSVDLSPNHWDLGENAPAWFVNAMKSLAEKYDLKFPDDAEESYWVVSVFNTLYWLPEIFEYSGWIDDELVFETTKISTAFYIDLGRFCEDNHVSGEITKGSILPLRVTVGVRQ